MQGRTTQEKQTNIYKKPYPLSDASFYNETLHVETRSKPKDTYQSKHNATKAM
jgi:hypothetical protein